MTTILSSRDRLASASATAIVHAAVLAALLIAWRAPFTVPRPAPAGLSVFDLGRSGEVAVAVDAQRRGTIDVRPPAALVQSGEASAAPANTAPISIGGGDSDPFALASVASVGSDAAIQSDSPVIALVRAAFAKAHPGLLGTAMVLVSTGNGSKIEDSRYVAGTLGTVRGALLAGYFRGCPLAMTGKAVPLQISISGESLTPLDGVTPMPGINNIDEKGCHG